MKGKIFNAQEVQAILAGDKTMFREVIKSQPLIKRMDDYLFDDNGKIAFQKDCCPYQVGQKIFCKESFAISHSKHDSFVIYEEREGCSIDEFIKCSWVEGFLKIKVESNKWKPAQHMKQEHSRLTLQIKEIRMERLRDISEEDCLKEGVSEINFKTQSVLRTYEIKNNFKIFWNATHKKPEEKFEANPWVWCVSFEVVK